MKYRNLELVCQDDFGHKMCDELRLFRLKASILIKADDLFITGRNRAISHVTSKQILPDFLKNVYYEWNCVFFNAYTLILVTQRSPIKKTSTLIFNNLFQMR